jgi:hypothetical protein
VLSGCSHDPTVSPTGRPQTLQAYHRIINKTPKDRNGDFLLESRTFTTSTQQAAIRKASWLTQKKLVQSTGSQCYNLFNLSAFTVLGTMDAAMRVTDRSIAAQDGFWRYGDPNRLAAKVTQHAGSRGFTARSLTFGFEKKGQCAANKP